jgi:hypothetical protein
MLRRLAFGTALAAAAAMASPGGAFEANVYQVSAPVRHDNLSVFFVRGQGTTAPVPLTLSEAVASGSARIHVRQDGSGTHMIDNLSASPIFVPAGALLVGGLQDQVVAMSTIVPPGASNVLLSVFCVEKGRSSARVGDDPSAFKIGDAVLPSQMARLIMLAGSGAETSLRQVGIWLSARSVLEALSRRLGGPVSSPRSESSLPLALENARVAEAQSAYVEALGWPVVSGDVIGAVFAVNGRLSSAEIFSSNELFRKMWPQLLRGYTTQAAAEDTLASEPAPSTESVKAFLSGAEQGDLQETRLFGQVFGQVFGQDKLVQDKLERRASSAALYSSISDGNGSFVQRRYLARADASGLTATLEGTVLQLLQTGLFEQSAALGFRPYAWDNFFQLVEEYQRQVRMLGGADPARPVLLTLGDYQRALQLASLNVERHPIEIRSPFTSDPIFTGSNRGDSGTYALFKVGLPILLGLLAFFAASRQSRTPSRALRSMRRHRGVVVEPLRRRTLVVRPSPLLSPQLRPAELRLAPAERGGGPMSTDRAPAAAGAVALMRGSVRLGFHAVLVLGRKLGDLVTGRSRLIGTAVMTTLPGRKPSGSGLAGCMAAPA